MISTDEFIARELAATDKRVFTWQEVRDMAERLIEERKAAAKPFEGWQTEQEQARPTARRGETQ